MSVFTTVGLADLEQFLKRYDLGSAIGFSPIVAGITNTNYCLETDRGNFVLTLYEHHSDDELDYMLGLQQHLADRGVLCPAPARDRRGDFYSTLKQRPAAINQRLPGRVETVPGPGHCALIGAELARFHQAGRDFSGRRPNPRGIDWLVAVRDMLDTHLNVRDQDIFNTALEDYRRLETSRLPSGAIHADLFHDNALFLDTGLGGIVDFDYACDDSLVLDIAVLLNDWCIDSRANLDMDRVTALLGAYRQQRQLDAVELTALPSMLRFSAARFWLSRLQDKIFPPSGELTYTKDPGWFRDLLQLRSDQADELTAYFSHMACGAK